MFFCNPISRSKHQYNHQPEIIVSFYAHGHKDLRLKVKHLLVCNTLSLLCFMAKLNTTLLLAYSCMLYRVCTIFPPRACLEPASNFQPDLLVLTNKEHGQENRQLRTRDCLRQGLRAGLSRPTKPTGTFIFFEKGKIYI